MDTWRRYWGIRGYGRNGWAKHFGYPISIFWANFALFPHSDLTKPRQSRQSHIDLITVLGVLEGEMWFLERRIEMNRRHLARVEGMHDQLIKVINGSNQAETLQLVKLVEYAGMINELKEHIRQLEGRRG